MTGTGIQVVMGMVPDADSQPGGKNRVITVAAGLIGGVGPVKCLQAVLQEVHIETPINNDAGSWSPLCQCEEVSIFPGLLMVTDHTALCALERLIELPPVPLMEKFHPCAPLESGDFPGDVFPESDIGSTVVQDIKRPLFIRICS